MAQELTFNISEDRRKLQGPVEAKNFNLKFGTDDVAITNGNPKQWVQGRIGDNELKQVFVNITEGENNTPKDVAGLFLAFVGIIHDKDGRPHRVVDYKHSTTIDVEHGRFRFDFPDQAFTVAGEYQQAFFMLVKEGPGGGCVATMEFDMQVMANFVFTDLVPEDYITPFNDTVDQLLAACKKFKDDTAADEAKFKQELEDAYAKFQKDTNTQFNNFKDATDEDLANFKKANADDIAKFKQQYADAVQAKEDELQSKVDSYTDKIDTMLKDLNQQGIDTTTLLTTLQANIKTLEEEIKQNNLVTQPQLDTFKQVIQRQFDELLKLSFEEGSEDNVTAQQSKSLYSYASEGLAKREALAPNVLRVGTLNLALAGALNIGIDVGNFWSETDKASRRLTENQMAMDWMGCNIIGCQEVISSLLSGAYNSYNRAMAADQLYPNLYIGLSPEVNHQLQTWYGMREGNAIFADRQMSYVALAAYSSDPNRSYLAYRTTFNNKNVLVVVTHNNVNDESEFEQLATFCTQQTFDACIILADTNNDPDSQCIAKLLAAGFDIVSKKDDNTMITEPAYSGHQMQIFYKGCVLQKKELYDVTTFEGSDHKAIVAEFKVGD